MYIYYLRALTEKKLKQALPNWMLDDRGEPLEYSYNHTLVWDVKSEDGGKYFYARLCVADTELAENIEETLLGYLVPSPSARWDIYN